MYNQQSNVVLWQAGVKHSSNLQDWSHFQSMRQEEFNILNFVMLFDDQYRPDTRVRQSHFSPRSAVRGGPPVYWQGGGGNLHI